MKNCCRELGKCNNRASSWWPCSLVVNMIKLKALLMS